MIPGDIISDIITRKRTGQTLSARERVLDSLDMRRRQRESLDCTVAETFATNPSLVEELAGYGFHVHRYSEELYLINWDAAPPTMPTEYRRDEAHLAPQPKGAAHNVIEW
jgi:hypothetical protein